ncbi:hypothetical protein [Thermanaeromonas sp. C210]|uniref:hypothetical protein n=1 Tax=Thermanaeromonas sp. C210 TaxID=2731925 RepID=UPI0015641A4E|nr:hypothetical protein [Thermanaeromonas sp. C210]
MRHFFGGQRKRLKGASRKAKNMSGGLDIPRRMECVTVLSAPQAPALTVQPATSIIFFDPEVILPTQDAVESYLLQSFKQQKVETIQAVEAIRTENLTLLERMYEDVDRQGGKHRIVYLGPKESGWPDGVG